MRWHGTTAAPDLRGALGAMVCALTMMVAAGGAGAQTGAPASTPTAPADAALGDRALQPFWARRLTGYVTTRDGTRLRYSVLVPAGKGPFPVIVNYSGYDPGSLGGKAYLAGDTTMSASIDRTLVEHGYAVAGVNARGTACSEGVFSMSGQTYGEDGRDAVEFFAVQPWTNGKVGMANWSWAGISQLATAEQRPPHLTAIAPGMVVGDPRLDNAAPGGVPEPGMESAWWNEYIPSRWEAARVSAEAEGDSACIRQIAANLISAQPGSATTFSLQHPLRDAEVEARHVALRAADIQVPVLSFKAYQDEAVSSREDHYQDRLRPDQVWSIQTNGPHDAYESLAFRKILVDFFDRFVKGEANGFEKQPHVQVWLESATSPSKRGVFEGIRPRTVYTRPSLPVAVVARTLNLSGGGRLIAGGVGTGAGDAYAYPEPGPAVNIDYGGEGWGALPANWRKGSISYTSEPLTQTLVTYGSASADLWLSATAADTDLQVTLTEVRPDGQEVYVQRGWLRASDRALDASRSTPTQPWLLDTPETMAALIPGGPVLARVEINPMSHPFRAGSRIRIWIDTPSATGEYRYAYNPIPSTNTVWHDAGHPSRLVLGVLPDVVPAETRAACGQMVMEPCRPDPLAAAHP